MTAIHATLTPKQLAEHVVDEAEARRVLAERPHGLAQACLFALWCGTCFALVDYLVEPDPIIRGLFSGGLALAGLASVEWSRAARRLKAAMALLEIEQARRAT